MSKRIDSRKRSGASAGPARHVLATLAAAAFLFAGAQIVRPQQSPAEPPAAAPASSGPQSALPQSTYAGDETCATCHDTVFEALQGTAHGKAGFAKMSSNGCESCHGPASAHVENPDDVALRPRFDRLGAEERSESCQSCHEGSNQAHWKGSVHEANGVSCDSCHSIHDYKSETAQLKTAVSTDTCTDCHADVRAELWKTSHHPVREGRMTCNDCHNPHGTPTDSMLVAASANDTCYGCHAEKRGPFLWEHAPVRESCMTCHAPHGSNHLKLQKTSVPFLCQQCHSNTRHPGTLYDGTTLAGASRASNRVFNRACLDCHPAIHGGNHPSGPYLGR
jgi:DmsE family decaheme c-type cytochrome